MDEKKNEEMEKDSKYFRIKKFPFIMGIFLVIFLSVAITAISLTVGEEKVQQPPVNEYSEFNKLFETLKIVEEKYYTDIDEDALINGAIDGLLGALNDPYTTYMDASETKNFTEQISSSFEGIGAEIQEKDSQIMIVSPIKGTPAEKAGLQPNDIIVSVDGTELMGMSSTEAVKLIKGEKGTTVELIIQRGSQEPFAVKITRDTIPVETVYAEMLDNGIASIHLTSFSTSTMNELTTALGEMTEQGMKGLVLDLRGNPGGLMDQAVNIANLFVPNGEIIFQVEYGDGEIEVIKASNKKTVEVPMVVLVDSGSASASEIVAAAVSESADIQIIGSNSFGKGTVQTTEQLEDDSMIKLTYAKWLTPQGNWVHEKGIKPDIEVELPSYAQLSYISPDEQYTVGSSSAEVNVAEQMLDALGYDIQNVDYTFDKSTEAAIKKLQADSNLKQTGILEGDTTLALMNQLRELILQNDTQLDKAVEVLTGQIK